jgi:hypothetical protein
MFANWLESISVEMGRVSIGSFTIVSRTIPYIEGEKNYSHYRPWVNAIIFNFLIKLYSIERDQRYVDFASSLLNYIKDYMNKISWKLDPTFIQGASGIGYYLASALLALRMTQSPITYTITSMVTRTEVVTITVPESTLTITLRSLFSEDLLALAVAVAMVIASIAIGLKLRMK